MERFTLRRSTAAAALAACFIATTASASTVTISTTPAPVIDIPGLTGFMTTGADMTGLSVRAVFASGLDETVAWATNGAASGGVTGTGWSLTLTGDSFTAPWNFTFTDPNVPLQLTTLVLDGRFGLTVFDRTLPNTGTAGSAQGRDFAFNAGCGSCDAFVDYVAPTGIGGNAPVDDLWQIVAVSFINPASGANTGPRENWSFLQDTDNDSRFVPGIPEPETYALMLAGLGLMGFVARRRKQKAA